MPNIIDIACQIWKILSSRYKCLFDQFATVEIGVAIPEDPKDKKDYAMMPRKVWIHWQDALQLRKLPTIAHQFALLLRV